ncbi:hypothetical protein EON65_15535 [archaeon]|nr:MAG: hypothetical protein EON65_15535 [archaeon]
MLKSIDFAFGQDVKALKLARIQLKQEFVKNKNISDSKHLQALMKDVDDIDEMLRFHIVQGKKNEKGSFGKFLNLHHSLVLLLAHLSFYICSC